MEYAPCGDLHAIIRKQDTETGSFIPIANELSWNYRYHIALDIARGMQYLHSLNIVHRDLRSPNIFIMQKNSKEFKKGIIAKVADFGLSIFALPTVTGALRTWRWLAPEVFHFSATEYDTRSDIYSFGIVLWELIEGAYPFGEFPGDEWDVQEAIVNECLRPTIPDSCDPIYSHLIEKCWDESPGMRPNWDQIITTLCHLLGDIDDEPIIQKSNSVYLGSNTKDTLKHSQRFSSFSDATKETKYNSHFKIDQQLNATVYFNDKVWFGSREGKILIYNSKDIEESQKSDPIKSWNVHKRSIINLELVEDINVENSYRIWSFTSDGNIFVFNGNEPYEQLWTLSTKSHLTGICTINHNNHFSIWAAVVSSPDTPVVIQIWDGLTYNQSSITLPQITDKAEYVTDIKQYEEIVLIGLQHHVIIVNIEQRVATAYFEIHSSERLKKIVSVPKHKQLWTFADNNVYVWEMGDDYGVQLIKKLEGHTSKITSVCLHNNEVWSSSFDGHIIVWDIKKIVGVREIFLEKETTAWDMKSWNNNSVFISATGIDSYGGPITCLILCNSEKRELRKLFTKKQTYHDLLNTESE